MKTQLQIFKTQQFSKGFTLTELLVAMSITLVVITLAGSGLVTLMTANQKTDIETQRRTNLNRALDYIADEVRAANKVNPVLTGSSFPGSGTGVLLITQPPASVPSANIVYFIRPSTTNWAGPNTINRLSGTYSTASAINISTGGSLLVDGVADVTANSSCTSGYRITVTNGSSACIPSASAPVCGVNAVGNNGFYACIGTDNRTVDLYLYGQINDTNPNKFAMVTTKVFARNN
jgi:prepilin-type N-terminal cleavage/methylation domain-containing protein